MKLTSLNYPFLIVLTLIFVACSSNNGPGQNSVQLVADQKPWEKIYFQPIEEKLHDARIEQLRTATLTANSVEIRIWAGFDTSPLRGLILRREAGESAAQFLPPSDARNSSSEIE